MKYKRVEMELSEAVSLVRETLALENEEILPLSSAYGMVVTEDIVSNIDQPPFDRSPLDGYALRSADTVGASPDTPVTLEVVDKLFAGNMTEKEVKPYQGVRIMTGAPIPSGCDCIIRQEETDYGEKYVKIYRSLNKHENYCFRGEDFKVGTVLIPKNTRLNSVAMGVLASAGILQVPVRSRLKVALITTGDELIEVSQNSLLPPGKIYSSNLAMLRTRLWELNLHPISAIQVGDNSKEVEEVIKKELEQADVLITTGGVSVGEKDVLNEVIEELGAQKIFHGVKIKPGTPAMFSLYKGKPILSLSGNPFAAATTFELLGRPLLSALMGDSSLLPIKAYATLTTPFHKETPSRRFLRGKLEEGSVVLGKSHSSGQLQSMVGCNCLVEIPENSILNQGDTVSVYLL